MLLAGAWQRSFSSMTVAINKASQNEKECSITSDIAVDSAAGDAVTVGKRTIQSCTC